MPAVRKKRRAIRRSAWSGANVPRDERIEQLYATPEEFAACQAAFAAAGARSHRNRKQAER